LAIFKGWEIRATMLFDAGKITRIRQLRKFAGRYPRMTV